MGVPVKRPDIKRNTPQLYYSKELLTVQRRPYDVPTSYRLHSISRTTSYGTLSGQHAQTDVNVRLATALDGYLITAQNKAYERFVSKFGDKSSFGATITAERRESFGMISGFLVALGRSMRSAKRGDILGTLSALGFNPPLKLVTRTYTSGSRSKHQKRNFYVKRKRISQEFYRMPDGRMVAKKAANTWLLWSYGVQPLLSDIHNATDVFVRDFPIALKARGGCKVSFNQRRISDFGNIVTHTYDGFFRAGLTSLVTVKNPDVWLANQLGLINPIQFLNEAVPTSFVFDWFSNWSSVVNSLSDGAGLSFKGTCSSVLFECVKGYTVTSREKVLLGSFTTDQIYASRSLGATLPRLQFKLERFEWQRGLNAISLLLSLGIKSDNLPKKKR